jgi:hypothetical protein
MRSRCTAIRATLKTSTSGFGWIERTRSRWSPRSQFGFGALGLTPEDFLVADQIVQLGYPPNRIDLLTSLPGVEFSECYHDRVVVEIDGVAVNFIDLENLRKNKQATGRYQDLADLENLT